MEFETLINEQDIALIDRFINGELESLEHLEFERRVKSDLEFAKEVRLQQKVIDGLKVYGAAQMVTEVKSNFEEWKSEGHKAYSPSSGMQLWVKLLIGAAIVGAAAVAYVMMTKSEHKEAPVLEESSDSIPEIHPVGPENPAPTDTGETDDVSNGEDLIRLKTDEVEEADLTLDIKDVNTFSVEEVSVDEGIYTYEIKYDGTSQTVKTDQADLDERLTKMAEDRKAEAQNVPSQGE